MERRQGGEGAGARSEEGVTLGGLPPDAETIVGQMKRGKGTVGALMMDEQLYDDLQEMVRDVKHNPWKFFWRE